ncbi:FGGY family carbohydrate kinase [Rhodobacter calidifons]|uniref:ATP:glycerol 3-phosphotransferase n=1 Tax=Rhodobacter calidifons TaxID=2715277 RepID=A0ABX0G8Y2_9RHOB|nr:FGGY family carbohydrate kinase [Rhodobacter calidifons]NHB77732.1 glycerol kinase [Rhodobacter calidifons]
MRIAAIDQGTTSTRVLLLRADGGLDPLLSLPHAQTYPAPGHVEQDGEELLANVRRCLDAAGADVVGLANQGESCLAWDARDGRPVSPVISWQDDRTADVTAGLERDGAGPLVMARAGLPLDPYFSASKLGWILRHVPAAATLAAQGRLRLGTTDAFFRDRLTGRCETDIATASRTSLMNLDTGAWDPDLCALFGVPMACLPRIGPTSGELGPLPGGALLAASIVDQQAALYGHGCRRPGAAKVTFGTGAFVQCLTGALVRPARPGPLPTVAWQKAGEPVTHALDGGVYAAASAVNWARGLGLFDDHETISAFAAPPAIDRGLIFVPALAGLGCPHWQRAVRGAWLGLGLDHGKADLMQALLEGVALRTAEVLDAMRAVHALDGAVSVDGGLARNAYFVDFLSEVAGQDLHLPAETEQTAMGLALMAAEACGLEPLPPGAGRLIRVGQRRNRDRLDRFAAARQALSDMAAAQDNGRVPPSS